MRSLTVIGRRWFQKLYGNTYHTAQIIVDGEIVHTTPAMYGYGNHYEQSAAKALEISGHVELEQRQKGIAPESLFSWCDRNGVAYEAIAIDVDRKRDL